MSQRIRAFVDGVRNETTKETSGKNSKEQYKEIVNEKLLAE